MDIINNKKSKTTIFILPLLYSDTKYTQVLTDNFINCYILDNNIIIEFDNDIVKFKIPQEFTDDYKKITKSLYSKISDKSKEQILNFWDEDKSSYLYSVLYKTKRVLNYWQSKTDKKLHLSKEKEYWPKFNIIEESYGMLNLKLPKDERNTIFDKRSDKWNNDYS